MVYVIAELRNYRQLTRLRAQQLAGLESQLAAAFGSLQARAAGPGLWVAEAGSGEGSSVHVAAEAAVRVRDFLGSRRGELFGFAVLLARLPVGTDAALSAAAGTLLEGAEDEERLWIAPDCSTAFAAVLSYEPAGGLMAVTGQKSPPPPSAGAQPEPSRP
jgi:hypothetical protein